MIGKSVERAGTFNNVKPLAIQKANVEPTTTNWIVKMLQSRIIISATRQQSQQKSKHRHTNWGSNTSTSVLAHNTCEDGNKSQSLHRLCSHIDSGQIPRNNKRQHSCEQMGGEKRCSGKTREKKN